MIILWGIKVLNEQEEVSISVIQIVSVIMYKVVRFGKISVIRNVFNFICDIYNLN